ncbi:hypothetical protein LTR29_002789 [Friedmanniomyces endolithicus]|nr:hypothetical protein LTR29_002789 [Friedmanniomyces endolithicus]
MKDQRGSFRLFSVLGECLKKRMLVQIDPTGSVEEGTPEGFQRFPKEVFRVRILALGPLLPPGSLHRIINTEWAISLANVQRRCSSRLDQRLNMGHIRFDDEGATPIIRAVHHSDQLRTVAKPPRRSTKIITVSAPNATWEEPQRKRRRTVNDRFWSSRDTDRQGKGKDGKPWKVHGRLSDPLASKHESTIRPAVSVAVAEVVRTRDAGGVGLSARRERKGKRQRQSDVERGADIAGEHAGKDAVKSVPDESVPVYTASSKEKRRFRKRDATVKKESGSTEAVTDGKVVPTGDMKHAPEASREKKDRKKKPKRLREPRTDVEDIAVKNPPPTDATTESMHQQPVHDLKVEVANAMSSGAMPQPSIKKRKRGHTGQKDHSFAADPRLEGQTGAVGKPESKKRKRKSLTVPTLKTEAVDASATAPVERASLDVGDTVATAGNVKESQTKPTHHSVPLRAPNIKVEADVQWNNQGQKPEGVHRRVPSSGIEFEKVISEIQWALDDVQRVCSLLPLGYNKRTPPSAWLQEIRWNVRNIGDHLHEHLAKEEDALVRAWSIVCGKYMNGHPRKYYFATGDAWRRQYMRYEMKGEDAKEHRERFNGALEIRNAHAQALGCSRLKSFCTADFVNKEEQSIPGASLDAVPVGSQNLIRSGSPKTALKAFVTDHSQVGGPMSKTRELSAKKPDSKSSRGDVESEGEWKYVANSRDGVHQDRARDSISPEFQRPGARRSPGPNLDRITPTSLPDPVKSGPARGPFTSIEKAAADDVLEYICKQYDLDSLGMRGNMSDWKRLLPELKVEMRYALPNRTKDAVRAFCQRRYIPKTEGFWTKEEDEMLLKARSQYSNRWSAIAALVNGRTRQQCRDRYWNNLHFGEKIEGGLWGRDEEVKLISIVSECIKQIKQAIVAKGDLINKMEEVDTLVNWNVVSDKLGTQRSNHKVRKKWKQLKRRNPDLLNALEDDYRPALAVTAWYHDGQSDPQKRAAAQYRSFERGDTYDVLVEIHKAITDHRKIWSEEVAVWTTIGRGSQGSRFSSALRRKAYQEALGKYGRKKAVRAATTIAGKAKAMAESMEWRIARRGTTFVRGYAPKLRGKQVALQKEHVQHGGDDAEKALARRQLCLKRRRARRWREKVRERRLGGTDGDEENRAAVESAPAKRPRPVRLPRSKKVSLSTEMVGNSDEDEDTDTGADRCPLSGSNCGNTDI